MASFKFSAVYTYRREKNTQASANPDNPYATTLTTAVDPGLDGFVGTADDGTYGFYQRLSAANRTLDHQRSARCSRATAAWNSP